MRGLLIAPAILNLLTSLFWITLGMPDNTPVVAIGMFLVVIGVLCLFYSRLDESKLYDKRKVILAFGIIMIPFNFISAILLIIASDRVGQNCAVQSLNKDGVMADGVLIEGEGANSQKTVVSKQVKKVDGLLKLGIAMVAIAGVMISTTSWDIISDITKMIIIALIGVAFLGLSFFSDKKLKLRGTTITYWFLSMIAFSLSIFMIGNYEVFGNWFSVHGEGSDVFVSVFLLFISALLYITYRKFELPSLFYIACFGVALATALVVKFVAHDREVCILVLTILVSLMNFIPKSEKTEIKVVKLFGIVISFMTTVLLVIEELHPENEVIVIITALIQIANLTVLAVLDKKEEIKVLSGIGIIAIVTMALTGIYLDLDDIAVLLINRSIILAVTLLICGVIVRNKKISNIILSVVLPLLILSIIFTIEIPVAIYIGCITLAMILLGFFDKSFKSIYIEGIIFLIANLVIQLWEFWGLLPVWAYLLIGGFSLIGVVTVKELKKKED